jgi:hypothetical protein
VHCLPACTCRMFRLVSAASLLQHFASDRSHMRRPDGCWCAEPPPYPCITAADGACMNLGRYRNMSLDVLPDRVPCQHTAPCQHRGLPQTGSHDLQDSTSCQHRDLQAAGSVAAAAGEAVKNPCQPAAGMIAVHTATAIGVDAGSAVVPVGSTDLANAKQAPTAAAGGSAGHVEHVHNPSKHHMHGAAAGALAAGGFFADRLATWGDVEAGCRSTPYGVVLHEATLLRCLLAEVV